MDPRTRIGRAVLAPLATVLLAAASPPVAVAEGVCHPWEERIERAFELLAEGEPARARRQANQLIWHLGASADEGETARCLAHAELVRALAEADLGRLAEAAWRWRTAAELDPSLGELDPASRGASGELLAHRLAREAELVESGSRVEANGPGTFREPRVARRRPVVSPPAAKRSGNRGKVMVRVLVDGDGRPLAPRVLYASVGPRRLHAALDSLREWQFDPAEVDGVPVPFVTLVAVEFGGR